MFDKNSALTLKNARARAFVTVMKDGVKYTGEVETHYDNPSSFCIMVKLEAPVPIGIGSPGSTPVPLDVESKGYKIDRIILAQPTHIHLVKVLVQENTEPQLIRILKAVFGEMKVSFS